jgi:hypothetical protein
LLSGLIPALVAGVKIPPISAVLLKQFLADDLAYFICVLPIIAAQYIISLFYKNFLVPVGVGFIAWIGALSLLSQSYNLLFPYTYVVLRYLHGTGKGALLVSTDSLSLIALGWFVLITLTGYLLYMLKKEKG